MNGTNRTPGSRVLPSDLPTLCCESVERWLGVSPGVTPPTVIRSHLDHCHHCREEWLTALPLRSLVSEKRSPGAADLLFVRSVMARVRQEPPPVRNLPLSWLRAAAAVVVLAVVLVVISVGDFSGVGGRYWAGDDAASIAEAASWTTDDSLRMVLDPYENSGPRALCSYIPVFEVSGDEGLTF